MAEHEHTGAGAARSRTITIRVSRAVHARAQVLEARLERGGGAALVAEAEALLGGAVRAAWAAGDTAAWRWSPAWWRRRWRQWRGRA